MFLGGPKDGKREFWPLNHYNYSQIQCVTQNSRNDTADYPADLPIGVTTHTYTLKHLRVGNKVLRVAAHSTIGSVEEQLIKGYRYNRRPRVRLPRHLRKSFGAGAPPKYWMNPNP